MVKGYLVINHFYPTDSVLLKIGWASMMERLSVETWKAVGGKMPGKFLNCSCEEGKCVLNKDRGWLGKRLAGE